MPQENSDSRITVEKVLRLEQSTGFRDVAVTAGLEAFIHQTLPEAEAIASGYADAEHFERQRIVQQLFDHLSGARSGAPEVSLSDPVDQAYGVGKKRAETLRKLGIQTMEDLLLYLPRRLEDRTTFSDIGALRSGQDAAIRGRVLTVDQQRVGRKMTVVKAAIGDGTGFIYAVWFNQPWIAKQLEKGVEIDLYGRVELRYREWQIRSPVWEPANTRVEVGRWVPIYPATEGVSDRFLRLLLARHLERYLAAVDDLLPASLLGRRHLPSRRSAIRSLHRPDSAEGFEQARRCLAFEELFLLQLGLLLETRDTAGVNHAGSGHLVNSFLAGLGFALTAAQQSALREIRHDLVRPVRMMRLLQGDVGSGKTLVAVASALHAIEAGYQVALMAPTEILAEQHAARIERLLIGLPVRVGLLTGATAAKESVRADVEAGAIDLLVGTHALIEETVAFRSLGFVVIDEQHRFGVVQRSQIEGKGTDVDLLVMSATPIPRTIALTLYGEFDVSVLDEFPLGEKRITTYWVAQTRREGVYAEIAKHLRAGARGYVILPLVEESEKVDAKAAVQVYEELSGRYRDVRVGLLHGRLSSSDKAAVMEGFRGGEIQMLVATTVVEVGVDVLDADFMVIEHAERFGLSQLHQLRGRIGRAGQPAWVFAIADAKTDEARSRLAAFRDILDGFVLAEEDLRIRGPGDLLGTHQHGFLSQFRAVDLMEDLDLMRAAQEDARRMHGEGVPDPIVRAIDHRFGDVIRWLRV